MQYSTLVDAILNSNLHTIPVQLDRFVGALYIIIGNNRMLFCGPNWEGPINMVCFEGEIGEEHTDWTVKAPFTDNVEKNVLIWASIVQNEIIKLQQE